MIKVNEELAGFVLVNKKGIQRATDWNVGEFFLLAKFQGQGLGRVVAEELWNLFPGIWEIAVIPENTAAALESRFAGQGFNNINLVTSAFQAPAFYQKCGYTLEYVRKNAVNPQLSKAFFVKFFTDEVQTQGLKIKR